MTESLEQAEDQVKQSAADVPQYAQYAQYAESPGRPAYRPSPTLIIFLIMPIAAAIAAFLIGSTVEQSAESNEPPIVVHTTFTLVGSTAPDFELPTPAGELLTLSGLRGQWVVLNFWATWCGPCREEMPVLQDLADGKFEAATALGRVTVLAVNRDESAEVIRAFMRDVKVNLPVVVDAGGKVSNRYGVIQMPITYFIDPAGVVRYKHIGGLTADLLDRTLRKAATS